MSPSPASEVPAPAPERPGRGDPPPLQVVHTPNFPVLLRKVGRSLLVTTDQPGKLVLVGDEGGTLDGSARIAPRGRPPCVTALEPTDRCHSSGPGSGDDRPRRVTAPGQTRRDHDTSSDPESFRTRT